MKEIKGKSWQTSSVHDAFMKANWKLTGLDPSLLVGRPVVNECFSTLDSSRSRQLHLMQSSWWKWS